MKYIFAAALFVLSTPSFAQYYQYGTGSNPDTHYRSGYYNNHGTYVEPGYATNPNGTQYDNYGSRGNYNPYSGHYGTRTPRY